MMAIISVATIAIFEISVQSNNASSKSLTYQGQSDPVEQAQKANDQCNDRPPAKDGDLSAIIDCAYEHSVALDDIVEHKCSELRQILPPARQLQLTASQQAWRAAREKRCTPKGKIAMFEVLQVNYCIVDKSILRVEWLDRRIAQAKRDRRARR
jgi:uncharacterized protein YecT (DUF1311 family)